MSELSPAVEVTIEMERERTTVLDELLNIKSDNFNRVDVSELILKYFEMARPVELKIRRNAWEVVDPAVRQLHTASLKVPRRRYFLGSQLERIPTRDRPQYSREASTKKQAIDQAKEDRFNRLRSFRNESTDDHVDGSQELLEELAAHMVENDLTAAAVQRQLSAAAEGTDGDSNDHLHALAVNLVREVLIKANRHVEDYRLREQTDLPQEQVEEALVREETNLSDMSITRIENIAKDMVQSVTDQVTAMLEAENKVSQEE